MEEIQVFYGHNKITVPKDSNFLMLKEKILKKDKKLVKYFIYENEKINESLLIINYPLFNIAIDKNDFCEYKKGQFRCKRCRKYLRLSNFKCRHSNFCRTYYNFTKKELIDEIVKGGYGENGDFFFEDEESQKVGFFDSNTKNEKKCDENDSDYELINKIINRHDERNKKKMLDKINRILLNNKKKEETKNLLNNEKEESK